MTLNSDIACHEPNFRSSAKTEPERLLVQIEGEANIDALESLRRVLDATHEEAMRLHAKEVVMDLTQLEFLNSSGVKHFVTWVRRAGEPAANGGYNIRLVSSPLVPWQRRGLEALRCFAPQRVTVDTATVQ